MAITTDNGKFAVLNLSQVWLSNLLVSPGTLGQDDQQQLLWGFPEILWHAGSSFSAIQDVNTRVRAFLANHYSVPETSDLTTLVVRYLVEQTGDYTARFLKMIQDSLT